MREWVVTPGIASQELRRYSLVVLIYFDLCALQRPHDDQSQFRIRMETAAILAILEHCRTNGVGLASSDVLTYKLG